MGNENGQQNPPSSKEEQEILEKLAELNNDVKELKTLRVRRSFVTVAGMGLVLLAIIIFIFNIISFVKNYDTQELSEEVGKRAEEIVNSEEMKELISEIQNELIPSLRDEFFKKFKNELPKFKEEGLVVADNLKKYIETEVKAKITEALAESLNDMKETLLKKYPDITPAKMDQVMEEAQHEFAEEFTKSLESRLDKVILDMVALNESFEVLTKHKDFKALDPKMTGEIENQLIEAMLELAIYHLDPKKGKQPVSKGGE